MLGPEEVIPAAQAGQGRRPMRAAALIVWGVLALLAFSGFVTLGNWQVERRAWKHELIERVQARIHAPTQAAPPRDAWPAVAAAPDDYEYRRVHLDGVFLHEFTSLVEATTVLGRGYWVMTPLRLPSGDVVFINRGFVPRAQPDGPWRARAASGAQAAVSLTGLLRLPEPEGAFLRSNDPAQNLWYARDVAQLARHHGLAPAAAPYFVDVEARTPLPPTLTLEPPQRLPDDMLPVAGLTVVSFNDNHLSYLLTWYGLALMVAGASAYLIREEYRLRRRRRHPHGCNPAGKTT